MNYKDEYLSRYIDCATGWITRETGVDFTQGRGIFPFPASPLPIYCCAYNTYYKWMQR
jgi:hypothetical protein